jgi:MoxR-like ATPase
MDNQLDEKIKQANDAISMCKKEISKRVIGQEEMVESVLMGIIAGGHVLLEGVPGLAKTLVVRTIAEIMDGSFKRIQFTPDLLPADLIGTMVYRPQTGEFTPRKGPIFSNIILADEINRAPAKVQSALLEAMQERQVTLGKETYDLDMPFFVLATQNPIEQEGTYPLPEAQLDRFIMKILVTYPSFEEEMNVLRLMGVERNIIVNKVINKEKLGIIRNIAESIRVDKKIEEYIVALVSASREKDRHKAEYVKYIEFGASPRASIHLLVCARIKALLQNRNFVLPEDVKDVAYNVMRHRIILTYEAESEDLSSDNVITQILEYVHVP